MKCTLAVLAMTVAASAATGAELSISRPESRSVQSAPARNFTGVAKVDSLFTAADGNHASGAAVTFSAGARTNWHVHPNGQTLIVTAGLGRVQRWGGDVEEIRPGDVVRIPAMVKHWHGAGPDGGMTHIAIQEAKDGKTVEWLEPVTAAQYDAGRRETAPGTPDQPTAAQRLMGDIAPKMAQLTDDVLFGDVWARPGLSRRDRSLVTVSALIAMNRPEQLRSHMRLGLQNGLSEDELVETMTQLAFYTGWPNAVTGVGVAREVFQNKASK